MTIARKYSRKMTVFRFPSLCDILILTFLRDRFWPFEHEADSYPQSFVARDKRRFPSLQFPGKNPWGRTPIGLTLGHVTTVRANHYVSEKELEFPKEREGLNIGMTTGEIVLSWPDTLVCICCNI